MAIYFHNYFIIAFLFLFYCFFIVSFFYCFIIIHNRWLDPLVISARIGKSIKNYLKLTYPDLADSSSRKLKYYWNKELEKKRPYLIIALVKTFFWDIIISAIFKLIWSLLICFSAFYFVRELVAFIGDKSAHNWYGWVISCSYLLACIILSIAFQQMIVVTSRVGVRMRAAFLTLLYEKAMNLEINDINVGDILNFATNDCSRMLESVADFHRLWGGALESFILIGLLFIDLGYSAFVALGILIILVIFQILIGIIVSINRKKNIDTTDFRVSIVSEIISSIKLVKLYAWEDFFAKQVKSIRLREFILMSISATIKTFNLMIVYIIPPFIVICVFTLYTYTSQRINPKVAFTAISILNTLRLPLVVLPTSLRGFAEFIAALGRLQKFLRMPEKEHFERSTDYTGIKMKYASFSYNNTVDLLHDLTFEIPPGKLCACIGRLGEGKTNLIHSILGEMNLTKGRFKVGDRIAYVPQTPFIFNGTVRDNILFGLPFNERRYNLCVFACALEKDFKLLTEGDMTILADRGANLSGGQRQRISLCRAVYSNADIFLLDSPLSAVDMNTAIHIFTHCIQRLLKGKTRLLVSHHLDLLPYCDFIAVMEHGKLPYFGKYNQQCIEVLQKLFPDQKLPNYYPGRPLHKLINSSPSIDELFSIGKMDSVDDFKRYDIKKETTEEEFIHIPGVAYTNHVIPDIDEETDEKKIFLDVKKTSKKQFRIPLYSYFIWIWKNNPILVITSFFIFLICQTVRIVSDQWIGWWSSDLYKLPEYHYIWIYGALLFLFLVLLLIRGIFFYIMTLRATTILHNSMFKKIIRAPMLYFNQNPVGKIVSHFSKDQDSADEALPDQIHVTTIYFMILLTTVVLICIKIPYYTAALFLLVIFFILIFFIYMPATQKLKTELSSTNASLFSLFSESLGGIVVIRAFKTIPRFQEMILERIDFNHKAYFTSQMLHMWVSFRMDIVSSLMIFITACLGILTKGNISSSDFGVVISNSFQQLVFSTWVVRGLSEINSLIGCTERISDVISNTPQEPPAIIKSCRAPDNWPSKGKIEIKNLVLSYEPGSKPVLNNVNLSVKGGEKIGVVGATGSGKTTCLMSLFRLVEPEGGEIFIDDIDVMKMGLTDLRSRLAIIPQESVLFKGTIRSNLDPFNRFTDSQLWDALDSSNLKQQIKAMPLKLESPVFENGSNYSLGQKQLICLARALLLKSPVVVFDEATASLDLQTDSMIQKIIHKEFAQCTILTIAHRLETIIDCDRILVLEAGQVAEFDTPAALLSNPKGLFTTLVDKAGPEASKSLRDIAFGKKTRSITMHDLRITPDATEENDSNSSQDEIKELIEEEEAFKLPKETLQSTEIESNNTQKEISINTNEPLDTQNVQESEVSEVKDSSNKEDSINEQK